MNKNLLKRIVNKVKKIILGSSRDRLLKLLPKNSVGIEIGVWKGVYSEKMVSVLDPRELHLVDPWKFMTEHGNRWYGGKIAKEQKDMDDIYNDVVEIFRNNTRVKIHRDLSSEVCNNFKDEYFDWVYVDGNHHYEFVKEDLEMYFSKIKKGGFIAGDDYFWSPRELNGDQPVKRAVDEFIGDYSVADFKLIGNQFIMRKK